MSRNIRYYMDPGVYTAPGGNGEAAVAAFLGYAPPTMPLPGVPEAMYPVGDIIPGYGYGHATYMDPLELPVTAPPVQAPPVQAGIPLAGIWALIMAGLQAGKGLIPLLQQYAPWLIGAGGAAVGAIAGTVVPAITGGGYNGGAVIPGTAIPLGGWGAPEPPAAMIAKQWAGIGGSQFYLLVNGRIVVRRRNGTWKLIKRVKMLHMKVSNPRMGDVVKADRIVARTAKILRRRLK